MIIINGIEIDFNMSAPSDVLRMGEAQERAEKRETAPAPNPDDPDYLQKYANWLDSIIDIFADFLDDLFGAGVSKKLMVGKKSLEMIFDLNDELEKALGVHVKSVTSKTGSKYKPNRATRRAGK